MKTALIIDDTKAHRIFMSKCLESNEYDVKTINNGRQAMEILKSETYSLIILDIKMPFMSGTQVLKWIKENSIDTPVIIVTAHGTIKNAIECIRNGAVAYIQKPFTMNRFNRYIYDLEQKMENGYDFKYNIKQLSDLNIENNADTRMSDDIILDQAKKIIKQNTVTNLFNIIPYSILVLNYQRQIIYSNNHFMKLIGIESEDDTIGFRPGEILKCIHSGEKSSGCGTTECCSVCGTFKAIFESQKKKIPVTRECLMTSEDDDSIGNIELLIYVAPLEIIDGEYTILVIKDISHKKRKEAIEQIFFHDILDTSGAIKELIDCMRNSPEIEKMRELISCAGETANVMIDEIKSQIDLTAAENGQLKLNLSRIAYEHGNSV